MTTTFFENTEIAKRMASFKLPRYDELNNFDVYMDQLVQILDNILYEFLVPDEENALTPSMINNYVQKKVIKAPTRKKYSKNHIVYLIVIGILKQVFPILELKEIIAQALEEYPIDMAYDYFCSELENALQATFSTRTFAQIEKRAVKRRTPLSENVRSAVLSFANRIYVKKSLYYTKHPELL